jgi:MFS transporter, PPP family, 3-phenylpropionic acid transporter
MTVSTHHSDLLRFALLFSVLYLGFGVASPFLPAFLSSRGVTPEQLGLVLSLATTIRLVSGPIAGRIADRLCAGRLVLAICAATAGLVALAFVTTHGFFFVLVISLLHAAMLAPTTVLADALALAAASPRGASRVGFEYGWVRGAGSAAFIIGTLASGQAVNVLGLGSIIMAQATFLLIAAAAALFVPEIVIPRDGDQASPRSPEIGVFDLIRVAAFRRLVMVAALILGSHAMHDSFAMISWNAAGISAGIGSILWSESVAAEVVVFLAFGPFLLRHVRPETAMAIAAVGAVLRWAVMAQTSDVAALALVEPLHGLTFALLHLSCMRVLADIVPRALAATAQAIYATLGIGATSAVLTLVSGSLYAQFGSGGFWVMAALAAAALPVIWALHRTRSSERNVAIGARVR